MFVLSVHIGREINMLSVLHVCKDRAEWQVFNPLFHPHPLDQPHTLALQRVAICNYHPGGSPDGPPVLEALLLPYLPPTMMMISQRKQGSVVAVRY